MPLLRAAIVAFALLTLVPKGNVAAQERRNGISQSLSNAIAAARRGDTVHVPAGIHRGLFVIDKQITLLGEPGAILDGGGKGTVLTVAADSVTVSSLRITGSGMSLDLDQSALRLQKCEGCVVENLMIDHTLHGIYLAESNGVHITDNVVTGDTTMAESRRGNAIHLFNSGGNRITGNVVHGTRDGIYFSFASGNTVNSNKVTGVRYGLHYMYSNDNTFVGNSFRRNAAGGAIMFSDRIVLRGNEFSEHVGYRGYGLLLQTAREVLAEGNRFSDNLIGLFIDNSNGIMFRDNVLAGNGIGVDLLPSSRDNTLVGNWFLENRTPVRIARGSGRSTWALNGHGNYWGSLSVFDLDGDGVGDRPLRVGDAFATLAQARPALEVFSGTPAASALSWAEEAFPAFRTLRVEDPSPLVARFVGIGQRHPIAIPMPLMAAAVLMLVLIPVRLRMYSRPVRSRLASAEER